MHQPQRSCSKINHFAAAPLFFLTNSFKNDKVFMVICLFYESIDKISGIGEKRKQLLSKLNIFNICDILYHFPRKLQDRSNIKRIIETADGEYATLKVTPTGEMTVSRIRGNLTVYKQAFSDESGTVMVTWFNSPFLKMSFKKGSFYYLCGNISAKYSVRQMSSPIYESAENQSQTGRIMPIYPLTSGISQKVFSTLTEKALNLTGTNTPEFIPAFLRHEYSLAQIAYSLKNIHFPKDSESYLVSERRLKFEEFFILQCALLMKKGKLKKEKTEPVAGGSPESFYKLLSFAPTDAQMRVISDIYSDLKKSTPMNRLVQGDVGCGKTVIAAFAQYCCACAGYQSVMMVPSEILATQHYESLASLFGEKRVLLLSGKLSAKEKKTAYEKIKSGSVKIIVGTHALIFDKVEFNNLMLVITDEQHRFGVNQRKLLAEKGKNPHVLVMSATPIPRTLTHVLYGDLDVSIIDKLPPGRQKVDTFVIDTEKRGRAYGFILKELQKGNQADVVCPLAEESENEDLKNIVKLSEEILKSFFKDYKVAYVHGKMKSSEKDEIMKNFSDGKINVLVATTVIEVGINVPKATVMMIENAERFGLSQLHQLRGRVGRGSDKSYCILISDNKSRLTSERLNTLQKTSDGFEISQADLTLRGPGDFFGTKQHGLPELKIANIFTDTEIMLKAREAAEKLLLIDATLSKPENKPLRQRIEYMFSTANSN